MGTRGTGSPDLVDEVRGRVDEGERVFREASKESFTGACEESSRGFFRKSVLPRERGLLGRG